MPSHDRRTSRLISPSRFAILGTLVIAFALAACAAAGPEARDGDDNLGGNPPVGEQPGTGDGDQTGSLADRKIIKTGEISVEVDNTARAVAQVRALALELGGYVGGSQSGTADESATLTLRIPADRFEDALAAIHELDGEVLSEATREEDVTTSVVDLDARLRNLQASEVQYRTLLGQAVKIEDILSVQTRLDEVRGQIEQLQAQLKELTGLADLATLHVTLVPGAVQAAAGNWDPGKTVTDAVAALVGFAQGLGNGAIWLAIVVVPALIALAIIGWLLVRLVPGLRGRLRRTPTE